MDEIIKNIIFEISIKENINLEKIINKYCKQLKKCFKVYYNTYGLEDYKMNRIDYIILYNIWKTLELRGCIESYLIIMYSYYKLDDFHFPFDKFKSGLDCVKIIKDTNTIAIIDSIIKEI